MKRLTALIFTMTIGLYAVAQTALNAPLAPIHADSIYLMDFFWDKYQHKASQLDATPVKHDWSVKKTSAGKVAKLVAQCDKAMQQASILGNTKGKADNLEQSVKLFNLSYQLALLTGHAKYIDFAEHILYNRILTQWASERNSKAWKEANDILRTIDQMAYSQQDDHIYINTLMRSNAHLTAPGVDIYLQTNNSSPWQYDTSINFASNMQPVNVQYVENVYEDPTDPTTLLYKKIYTPQSNLQPSQATIHIRIPWWTNGKNYLPAYIAKAKKDAMHIMINGVAANPEIKDGYAVITRSWAPDDLISIHIPTPILRITDRQDDSQTALQRGPIVYQFDEVDPHCTLNPSSPINHQYDQTMQCTILTGKMQNGTATAPFRALPAYLRTPGCKNFVPTR